MCFEIRVSKQKKMANDLYQDYYPRMQGDSAEDYAMYWSELFNTDKDSQVSLADEELMLGFPEMFDSESEISQGGYLEGYGATRMWQESPSPFLVPHEELPIPPNVPPKKPGFSPYSNSPFSYPPESPGDYGGANSGLNILPEKIVDEMLGKTYAGESDLVNLD